MTCISTSTVNPDSLNNHLPPMAKKMNHVLAVEHPSNALPLEPAHLISAHAVKGENKMKKFQGLRKASHFGPTLIVTTIGFAFATHYWWEGPAYVIAFAALPSSIAISKEITPPTWMWLGGALFGMAAHFINVMKDMDQDQASGINGLPQRLGKKRSVVAALTLIALGVVVLFLF